MGGSKMMIAQALATFQGVLGQYVGKPVDINLISAFATLVADIVRALNWSSSE